MTARAERRHDRVGGRCGEDRVSNVCAKVCVEKGEVPNSDRWVANEEGTGAERAGMSNWATKNLSEKRSGANR